VGGGWLGFLWLGGGGGGLSCVIGVVVCVFGRVGLGGDGEVCLAHATISRPTTANLSDHKKGATFPR